MILSKWEVDSHGETGDTTDFFTFSQNDMSNERIVNIRKKFIFLDALFMFQTFCCCLSSEIDPLFHLNLVVSDVRKDFDEDARKKILDYLHPPLEEKPKATPHKAVRRCSSPGGSVRKRNGKRKTAMRPWG